MTAPAFLGRRRRRGGVFNPLQLFANGEAGLWYDPGDLTAEKVNWRRNLLTWSEDFTNSAWTKSASSIMSNLVLWSEQFDNAAWTKSNATVTANAAVAPDGTTTADTFVESVDGVPTAHFVYQQPSFVAGQPYTYTLYAKAIASDRLLQIYAQSSGVFARASFNLNTGSVVSNDAGTAAITAVGSGWYRLTVSGTPTTTGSGFVFIVSKNNSNLDYTGNGSQVAFVWGAQLVPGSTAQTYTPTTGATAPIRFADPFGGTTASMLLDDSASNLHGLYQSVVVAQGSNVTASIFVKYENKQFFSFLTNNNGATDRYAYFDIVNRTTHNLSSGLTAAIQDVGSGWLRLSVTSQSTTAALAGGYYWWNIALNTTTTIYAGDGTGQVQVWGAQVELGTTASAYQRITNFTSDFLAAFPTHALYQDSAGTTPVTALGQPVGLALDKSRGALANVGPEVVTNGDFSSGTGWNAPAGWAIGSGVATATATNASLTGTGFPVVAGRTYRVSFDVVTFGGGTLFVRVGTGTATTFTSAGTKVCFLTASSTTGVEFYGGGVTCTLDNVSVREVLGVHAIQPTSASRPALDARVNLLTYSEQFDNAAWSLQTATVTANSTAAPDGTTTADTLSASATEGFLYRSFTAAATPYVWSIFAKANTTSTVRLDAVTGGFAAGASCTFTLTGSGAAGTVTHYGTTTGFVASIVSVGNGWYRCALTGTATATTWFHETMVAGSGNSVFAWGADLRLATDAAYPYQRVVTATDYADVGAPRWFLHDGVDDSLYTSTSLNLSGTDKVTVWAGVFKNSDAASAVVLEHSTGVPNNRFALRAPQTAAANYGYTSGGTALATASTSNTFAAPIASVLTGISAIGSDTCVLRVSGTQAATDSTDQGTGNYGDYVAYIGRRNNASLPLNGKLGPIIARGALTDNVVLGQAEQWMAGRTGLAFASVLPAPPAPPAPITGNALQFDNPLNSGHIITTGL